MYKRKIYHPAYHSKGNFLLYKFAVEFSLYLQHFKSERCLNVRAFYFQSHRIAKKQTIKL